MSNPCIITVAITGSLPTKKDNPAVPITIAEQVESTQAAFEAGATLAHCHVRNDDGTPTSSPERFGKLVEGLKKHCPGMVVQLSTGGRSGAGRERGGMLPSSPIWPRSRPAPAISQRGSTRTRPSSSTGLPTR
jgi:3-keto-5-aminohexanoate cleavage enzyme